MMDDVEMVPIQEEAKVEEICYVLSDQQAWQSVQGMVGVLTDQMQRTDVLGLRNSKDVEMKNLNVAFQRNVEKQIVCFEVHYLNIKQFEEGSTMIHQEDFTLNIGRTLGEGCFGKVYSCTLTVKNFKVNLALKKIKWVDSEDFKIKLPDMYRKIQTNTRNLLIPWVMMECKPDNCLYFLMERGVCSLADYIRHKGMLSWQHCYFISREIAAGLAVLHEAGLVHTDIKLENILLMSFDPGIIKVADFDLMQEANANNIRDEMKSFGMTVGWLFSKIQHPRPPIIEQCLKFGVPSAKEVRDNFARLMERRK